LPFNGYEMEPVFTKLPETAKDGTSITRKTYRNGKDGAEVVLVVIEGGGHTWPGQNQDSRHWANPPKNISANDLMWEFFEKHPMK
jgi:polyhydroxybutyrate depolymerase